MLEDMLHMYIMNILSKWDEYLHLIEFSYKNVYQTWLKIILFKVMYHRICNTPIRWDSLINRVMLGHDMLKEMEEEVVRIKQYLKVDQDR